MHDPMQRNWKHAVPKRKKEKSQTLIVIFRSVIIEGRPAADTLESQTE